MIPIDKQYHLIAGILLSLFCYHLKVSDIATFHIVLGSAIVKELCDYADYGKFDLEDIMFTLFGLVIFKLCI